MAHALGANLDAVRVREDPAASRMHAAAFTSGDTITFAPGRYRPDTDAGRRLIAHEVTHTLQQRASPPVGFTAAARGRIQRNDETPIDEVAIAVAVARITAAITLDDVEGAVDPLRKRTLDERVVIRERIIANLSIKLERWFVERTRTPPPSTAETVFTVVVGGPLLSTTSRLPPPHAKTAEEGLRLVWRAAPLIDRLEVYDEGMREIEQAQLDTIRGASRDERIQAQAPANKDRLNKVLGNLDEREEYDARKLLDVDRTHRLETANRMLDRGDDDVLFDAILDLDQWDRVKFVMKDHYSTLYHRLYGWEMAILRNMARGTEVEALIQRLRFATVDRRDDQEAVSAVIDRAVELLKERRELQGVVGTLSGEAREIAERRLRELDTLDRFMSFERTSDGSVRPQTFLGLVSGARDDPAKFANDAARLAEFVDPAKQKRFAFEVAKQRILLADGDTDAMRLAILQLHAPRPQAAPGAPLPTEAEQQRADEQLRAELLEDAAVSKIVGRIPNAIPRNQVMRAVEGDRFAELLMQFSNAVEGGRYGEVFHVTYVIAKNPGFNARLQLTATLGGLHAAMSAINHLLPKPRRIVDCILKTPGHLPLVDILTFMDDEAQLKIVFDDIGEVDRKKLRLGWYLTEHPPIGAPSPTDQEAITFYQEVKKHLKKSQTGLIGTFDDKAFATIMATGLGSEPTAEELASGEGRYRAALLWHDIQQQRLSLDRGLAAEYTETDETMAAAAREFDALWKQLEGAGTLSTIDFYALASLHRTFEGRAEEFADASRSISEMAAMIAATVAGIIVVVATGGAATPGVIALAAAAGGTTRIVTREMFGADYYNAMSSEGAKDILLGSVDGALSVVSGGLAARGTQLLGLSGGTLTRAAAKVAGEVAEEAAVPLGRRVLAGSVEAAIDGAFSGTVSEAFGAMVDERTWRRGIMDGLARVGAAALLGGLTGAVGGAVIGGAMPVLGAAGSRLWKAVARRGVESTIERAGMHATLQEARIAAKAGKVDDVNRLAADLEATLSGDEIMWLRQHLGDELRSSKMLTGPPGTVLPDANSKAAKLLGESSTTRVPAGEHLEAELDVVRKSQPQPSREPGYLDEVDLGNGHTWRRKDDLTWCRFSTVSLCGTKVGDVPLSEGAKRQLRVDAAKQALHMERQRLAQVGEEHLQFKELVDRLAARQKAGEKIDLASLTDAEKAIINKIEVQDFDTATLKDLQALRGKQGGGASELEKQIQLALNDVRKAELHLADVRQSHYDKLRQRSPGTTMRTKVIGAAKGKDFVSGLPPVSGALECDHIVPLREIADMPGFKRLDFDTQVKIANFEENLQGVDALVNSHRQDKSWRAQFGKRDQYTQKQLEKIIEHEDDMRKKIQDQIDKALTKAGKPTGPP
jgi:hypothetical protein